VPENLIFQIIYHSDSQNLEKIYHGKALHFFYVRTLDDDDDNDVSNNNNNNVMKLT
jgi:hypothetical protein